MTMTMVTFDLHHCTINFVRICNINDYLYPCQPINSAFKNVFKNGGMTNQIITKV